MVLGDAELLLAGTGADRGQRGTAVLFDDGTPLMGLAERMRRSPCNMGRNAVLHQTTR